MSYEFKFPDVGEGIHEGIIQKWLVQEGEKVKADQNLVEIETDKAVVEMPSPKSGTVYRIHAREGETIKVGETMVTLLLEGETADSLKSKDDKKPKSEKQNYTGSVVGFLDEAKEVQPIRQSKYSSELSSANAIKAAPAIRSLAKEIGVNLEKIKGTGPGGSITSKDVLSSRKAEKLESIKQDSAEQDYSKYGKIERISLHGVGKSVALKTTESIQNAPQVTNMNEADATDLSELREAEKKKYEEEGIKITFMPYLIKAVQLALVKNPYLNSSIEGNEIIIKKYYNIGIAVDTDEGLIVPVIKNVDRMTIKEIAVEMNKLVEEARSRKINLDEIHGGSFSITNLGSLGGEFFTPIVNYPESAILGVGKIKDKAVVKDGKITIRKIIPLSITYDHRIIDGAKAARFMNDFIYLIENTNELG